MNVDKMIGGKKKHKSTLKEKETELLSNKNLAYYKEC